MRSIICLAMLLTACSKEPGQPSLPTGTFVGQGRDRLCIAGESGAYRAGVIVYGNGDINCSASGKLEEGSASWTLIPKGEGDCRIKLTVEGGTVSVADMPAACSYYCGPGATLAGRSFHRTELGAKVVDIAGDPLC